MKQLLCCLMALTLALSSCGSSNDAASEGKIRVALLTWVGYGPIHLALNKGFFEGVEVEVKVIEDTAARRAALAAGSVDASVDIVDSFTNFLASGFPASVALKLDDSIGGDGIVARSDIGDIRDLEGKSVAYPPGQPSHFFLLALLEDAGMTIDDINSKHMEADQAGSAFIAGSVDAAVTWEPWLSKAADLENGKILTTSREKPGLIVDVLTVRSDFLEKRPEAVEAFIRGWFKAVEYWKNHTKESNLIMANALQIDPSEFETMVAGVRYADYEANMAFFSKGQAGNSPFLELMQKAARIWKREGINKKDIDPHRADGSKILLEMRR